MAELDFAGFAHFDFWQPCDFSATAQKAGCCLYYFFMRRLMIYFHSIGSVVSQIRCRVAVFGLRNPLTQSQYA